MKLNIKEHLGSWHKIAACAGVMTLLLFFVCGNMMAAPGKEIKTKTLTMKGMYIQPTEITTGTLKFEGMKGTWKAQYVETDPLEMVGNRIFLVKGIIDLDLGKKGEEEDEFMEDDEELFLDEGLTGRPARPGAGNGESGRGTAARGARGAAERFER